MFQVNKNPNPSDLDKFGWAMLAGFGVLGIAVWVVNGWLGGGWSWAGGWRQIVSLCCWIVGPLLWVISRVSPPATRRIYIGWMTAAMIVGKVMTTILLTVVFFLVLPVFSIIVRFGDPLRKRLTHRGTYWEDYKPHEPTLERLGKSF